MPRRLRRDYAGAWHHVFNRGVAKRTLFETARDARFFLACLARQVRRGNLEVHAYCLLTTHFHLLVRSPRGRLSDAMQRVQDEYARWFNRGRGRDGPLFRGRFGNRLVESEAYAQTLLRYIDRNPVEAGLVSDAWEFPHGSARHYLRREGPRWLHRECIEGMLSGRDDVPWDPGLYRLFLAGPSTAGERWIARRRAEEPSPRGPDPLDALLEAAPDTVRRWMDDRAELADGTRVGLAVASPATLQAVIESRASVEPAATLDVGRKSWARWEVLAVGALREFSGLRFREIEQAMGLSRGTVQERLRMHERALREDPEYRGDLARVVHEALRRDFPHRRGSACRDAPGRPPPVDVPAGIELGGSADPRPRIS